MQIGRKLYYEKTTGNLIVDTGERFGSVVETTIEQDFQLYIALQNKLPEAVGIVHLEYGQFSEQFLSCYGFKINLETEEIIFNFISPESTLEEAIEVKVKELDTACNTEILSGFYSDITGINRLYGLEYDDQINMEALKNNVALGLIADGTLEYYCKGGECEPWNNADFMVLYGQAMAFKTERIKTCKVKKAQAINATTIEELEQITW